MGRLVITLMGVTELSNEFASFLPQLCLFILSDGILSTVEPADFQGVVPTRTSSVSSPTLRFERSTSLGSNDRSFF